jgi:hypothetical protein
MIFSPPATDTPPPIIPDAAQGERRPNEPAFVGDGLPNTIAADPDDTFDYFQAQANAARERLWL